ncbi:Dbl homology domain-containing protein [Coprinopsis sp. MPI-PUGE-AT-0042]|nr:Dbl homology domain-containing protein [Coprinopsis sp. MPI-PUGE-AT-0042]
MQIRSKDVMERIPGLQPFTITDLLDRQTTNGLIKVGSAGNLEQYRRGILTVNNFRLSKASLPSSRLLPESILEEASLPPPNDLSGLFPRNAVIPGPPEPSIISRSPKTLSDAQPGPFEEPLRMLHPDDSHDSVQDTSHPQPTRRALITREFVETERKFVNQLELMHTYSAELVRRNIVNRDSMHQMFPNLGNILGFQRRFLIRLETTFEQVWAEQRWGQHFIDCERQLIAVYEPYCLQSFSASELLESKMKDMAQLNALIDVRELNALHGCPITRVCRYALVLEDLVKAATADSSYPHLEALKQGAEASKRIFTKINDTMDRGNRQRTVKLLERRGSTLEGLSARTFWRISNGGNAVRHEVHH